MRLFAAIQPPADVLEHLDRAVSVHRNGTGAALRWVPNEQRHITVAFFGEVPSGAVEEISEAMVDLAQRHEPFTLSLRGAGTFAGRTLWMGVGSDTDSLTTLMAAASRIEDANPRDTHRGHLTLARPSHRSHGANLAAIVHALAVYTGPQWDAKGIELFSSELGRGRGGGPLHEQIGSAPFSRPLNC